jgi:hypothetical protein
MGAEFWFVKPERERPLGRPRCGWENSVKIDLREIGFGSLV